jgi:hypothetical protein
MRLLRLPCDVQGARAALDWDDIAGLKILNRIQKDSQTPSAGAKCFDLAAFD